MKKENLIQLNIRIPKAMKEELKAAAASVSQDLEDFTAEVISVYFGGETPEASQRRNVALAVSQARMAAKDGARSQARTVDPLRVRDLTGVETVKDSDRRPITTGHGEHGTLLFPFLSSEGSASSQYFHSCLA